MCGGFWHEYVVEGRFSATLAAAVTLGLPRLYCACCRRQKHGQMHVDFFAGSCYPVFFGSCGPLPRKLFPHLLMPLSSALLTLQ